jgi:hypothetical protein
MHFQFNFFVMCVATSGDVHYALRSIETIMESSKSGDFAQRDILYRCNFFVMCVATSGDVHCALCFIETIVESSKSGDFAQRGFKVGRKGELKAFNFQTIYKKFRSLQQPGFGAQAVIAN